MTFAKENNWCHPSANCRVVYPESPAATPEEMQYNATKLLRLRSLTPRQARRASVLRRPAPVSARFIIERHCRNRARHAAQAYAWRDVLAAHLSTEQDPIEAALESLGINATTQRVELVRSWIGNDMVRPEEADELIERALPIIANVFDCDPALIITKSRKRELVNSRKVLFKLLTIQTKLSLKTIGQKVGGRDHSTVIHNNEEFDNHVLTERDFRLKATSIFNHLNIKPTW